MKGQQLAISFRPMKPRPAGSVKEVVSKLYDQVGGVGEVMRRLMVGKSQAYAFTDEKSPEEISLARALALTGPTATAVAEAAALAGGGIFTPLRPLPGAAPPLALVARSVKEHGEAIAEALKAIEDRGASPATRARVVREIDEMLSAAAALRGAFLEDSQ